MNTSIPATSAATPNSLDHNAKNHSKMMNHIDDRLYRYRARRLRFLINGDKLFSGINYALNTERIRSFDALLNDLTRSLSMDHLKLCKGVRYIFSIDGIPVVSLDDFQDGQTYVCSSIDTFVSIEYRASNGMPNWLVRNSACISSDEKAIRAKRQRALYCPSPKTTRMHTQHQRQSSPAPIRQHQTNPNTSHNDDTNCVGNGENYHNSTRNSGDNQNSQQLQDRCLSSRFQRTPIVKLPIQQKRQANHRETSHNNATHCGTSLSATRVTIVVNNNHSDPTAPRLKPKTATTNSGSNDSTILQATTKQQTPKKSLSVAQQQQQQSAVELTSGLFGIEVIKKYDVGRPIGDGHFSIVYCCMNKTTQDFCALKLIDKLKCKGRDDMIYNEVKILKRLKHPNIVKLIEEFDYPKQLYLILELVQDGDLFDAISNVTKFSEVHVATMIHNLSSALTYLHQRGIVHRDIKPENLLISVQEDGSQSVKLADFGLAVELDDNPLYSVCGTAFYVSPEMLNETGYDFKVDVWSTGVICFILLCGYPPFTSENESSQDELFDAILAGDFHFAPPYWSTISQHAKNLIKCMLTVDPDKRFTAEQVFRHPWTMGTSNNFEGLNPMNISRKIALQSHDS